MRRVRWLVLLGATAAFLLGVSASAWATKTVCASGCTYTGIQAAITGASPGATIKIGPGTYEENLVVNKSVTLQGSGGATVVVPATSKPVCAGGSLCGGEASNIVLVEANNVTISKLTLNGDNPSLTSGVVRGGADIDARNGIITNHEVGVFSGLTVSKVKVENVYLRGIYASSGGTFDFNHDTVENVQGEEASIAMFNFGGAGEMTYNKVSGANDAISANWSTGTKFIHNKVTGSGSGIHTDNNGGDGGTADVIADNNISACTKDGYGIFVFVPYLSATVEANKVKSCSVGLAAFGGAVSGEGPTFSNNTVDGSGALASGTTYGAYVTTDQLGFEFGDVTATLTDNKLSHFDSDMWVTQSEPSPGQPAGGHAAVTASPGNVFSYSPIGVVGEPGTSVNAKEDYWGCPRGPAGEKHCVTASGTVEYTPFLTAKP